VYQLNAGSNRECRDRCQCHPSFNTASTREYKYFTKSLFIDKNPYKSVILSSNYGTPS